MGGAGVDAGRGGRLHGHLRPPRAAPHNAIDTPNSPDDGGSPGDNVRAAPYAAGGSVGSGGAPGLLDALASVAAVAAGEAASARAPERDEMALGVAHVLASSGAAGRVANSRIPNISCARAEGEADRDGTHQMAAARTSSYNATSTAGPHHDPHVPWLNGCRWRSRQEGIATAPCPEQPIAGGTLQHAEASDPWIARGAAPGVKQSTKAAVTGSPSNTQQVAGATAALAMSMAQGAMPVASLMQAPAFSGYTHNQLNELNELNLARQRQQQVQARQQQLTQLVQARQQMQMLQQQLAAEQATGQLTQRTAALAQAVTEQLQSNQAPASQSQAQQAHAQQVAALLAQAANQQQAAQSAESQRAQEMRATKNRGSPAPALGSAAASARELLQSQVRVHSQGTRTAPVQAHSQGTQTAPVQASEVTQVQGAQLLQRHAAAGTLLAAAPPVAPQLQQQALQQHALISALQRAHAGQQVPPSLVAALAHAALPVAGGAANSPASASVVADLMAAARERAVEQQKQEYLTQARAIAALWQPPLAQPPLVRAALRQAQVAAALHQAQGLASQQISASQAPLLPPGFPSAAASDLLAKWASATSQVPAARALSGATGGPTATLIMEGEMQERVRLALEKGAAHQVSRPPPPGSLSTASTTAAMQPAMMVGSGIATSAGGDLLAFPGGGVSCSVPAAGAALAGQKRPLASGGDDGRLSKAARHPPGAATQILQHPPPPTRVSIPLPLPPPPAASMPATGAGDASAGADAGGATTVGTGDNATRDLVCAAILRERAGPEATIKRGTQPYVPTLRIITRLTDWAACKEVADAMAVLKGIGEGVLKELDTRVDPNTAMAAEGCQALGLPTPEYIFKTPGELSAAEMGVATVLSRCAAEGRLMYTTASAWRFPNGDVRDHMYVDSLTVLSHRIDAECSRHKSERQVAPVAAAAADIAGDCEKRHAQMAASLRSSLTATVRTRLEAAAAASGEGQPAPPPDDNDEERHEVAWERVRPAVVAGGADCLAASWR